MEITVLSERISPSMETYNKLVAEGDMFSCRIYALTEKCYIDRVTLYKKDSKNFRIVHTTTTYSVSKTLRRYARSKIRRKVIITPKSAYMSENSLKIKPLFFSDIQRSVEEDVFRELMPWIWFLKENSLISISINSCLKNDLYSYKKALAWYYKTQYTENLKNLDKSKLLYQLQIKTKRSSFGTTIINLHRFNPDLSNHIDSDYMRDCVMMAYKLNRRIDLSWSQNRLIQEHDEMSAIITNIVIKASNRPLSIKTEYKELNVYVGGLITTTGELAAEGLKQKHCVATYVSEIERGDCAIYHIEGYTLQVIFDRSKLLKMVDYHPDTKEILSTKYMGAVMYISQFRGYKNKDAPEELKERVQLLINKYNEDYDKRTNDGTGNTSSSEYEGCHPATVEARACDRADHWLDAEEPEELPW